MAENTFVLGESDNLFKVVKDSIVAYGRDGGRSAWLTGRVFNEGEAAVFWPIPSHFVSDGPQKWATGQRAAMFVIDGRRWLISERGKEVRAFSIVTPKGGAMEECIDRAEARQAVQAWLTWLKGWVEARQI